ncbi:MAG: hypothetical protein KDA65_08485 [Planctomycetaceae bacterium]|nr:hypothetical protein [Planctomycetaceae bacterium]
MLDRPRIQQVICSICEKTAILPLHPEKLLAIREENRSYRLLTFSFVGMIVYLAN